MNAAPTTRRRNRPFAGISWLLAIASLFFFLSPTPLFGVEHWIIGLVFVIVAITIDRPRYLCGACGNRVERTSTLCPSCHTPILDRASIVRRPGGA